MTDPRQIADRLTEACTGCGSTEALADIQARGFVACCPDRRGAPTYVEGFGGPSTGEIYRARAILKEEQP